MLSCVLGIHEGEDGGEIRREVSFSFIWIPNLSGTSLIFPSVGNSCFVRFQAVLYRDGIKKISGLYTIL